MKSITPYLLVSMCVAPLYCDKGSSKVINTTVLPCFPEESLEENFKDRLSFNKISLYLSDFGFKFP